VREKRGFAYSVYSFVSSHVDTGMFGVYMGVDPRRAEETTRLVLDELFKMTKQPVTVSELSGAIEYTRGSLLLGAESTDNQMVRTAQNEIHFGCDLPLETIIEKIEAVTADDIQQLACRLFDVDHMALTLLGPADTDKKEFEKMLLQ
jgi:predicted Zn-dependent peptidase